MEQNSASRIDACNAAATFAIRLPDDKDFEGLRIYAEPNRWDPCWKTGPMSLENLEVVDAVGTEKGTNTVVLTIMDS